jgi:hypothetical protein
MERQMNAFVLWVLALALESLHSNLNSCQIVMQIAEAGDEWYPLGKCSRSIASVNHMTSLTSSDCKSYDMKRNVQERTRRFNAST